MLLFTSSLIFVSSSTPTVTLSPVNTFTSNALILCHCFPQSSSSSLSTKPISKNTFFTCALRDSPTQNHVYPDPSPQFAESETKKFKVELLQKLSEDVDEFGDDLHAVIDVCAQVNAVFFFKNLTL
ncbi:hypothetical protein SESBI_46970 [Sesbania bispinosa]|nr:hypothetical protein SESBI_46970 [Sesbania bispinosa]